jgi:hypothetical protein
MKEAIMALFWSRKERNQKGRKYWQRHQQSWAKSGMSQAEYCRTEGISLSSFTNWRSKLTSGFQECSDFVEVPAISAPISQETHIEIVNPSVGIIRIPETISPELLRIIFLTVKSIS